MKIKTGLMYPSIDIKDSIILPGGEVFLIACHPPGNRPLKLRNQAGVTRKDEKDTPTFSGIIGYI